MEYVSALRGESFDEGKPSLFELLSEQQLSGLLPPTLRYLLTVATLRYPRYLLRICNSFDELYALGSLAVERHYLRTRGGSFTENFYGLKRERCGSDNGDGAGLLPRASAAAPDLVRDALRLRDADVWRNLAVLVGVPYLKRKLDDAYDADAPRAALLGDASNRRPARGAHVRDHLVYYARWFLRNVYPSVHAAYHFATLAFGLAYLFDGSRFHHPLLWLIGTRVRRMAAADYRAIDALEKGAASAPTSSLFSPRGLASRALSGLSVVLPVSIILLKFLEWWHASDFGRQLSRRAADALELPPPVAAGLVMTEKERMAAKAKGNKGGDEKQAEEEEEVDMQAPPRAEDAPVATPSLLPILTVRPPTDSSLCPICGDEIVTATACQTGVVYCYKCIHHWVAGTHPRQEAFMADMAGRWESGVGRCAVTGRRVLGGTEGLRRIMT